VLTARWRGSRALRVACLATPFPPVFRWLKIHGTASLDDFALDGELTLVVSERALEVLTTRSAHACVRPEANAKHEGEM